MTVFYRRRRKGADADRRHALAWLPGLLALWAVPGAAAGEDARRQPEPWQAQVIHVVDGDSVWLRPQGSGRRVRARLDGIDAPEICQPGGRAARQVLQAKVLNQPVQVTVRAHDGYGRAIARLVRARDGVDVAAQMVREGWGWADAFRGRPGAYGPQEALARQDGLGVFAEPEPERPADFRRRHGPCTPRD